MTEPSGPVQIPNNKGGKVQASDDSMKISSQFHESLTGGIDQQRKRSNSEKRSSGTELERMDIKQNDDTLKRLENDRPSIAAVDPDEEEDDEDCKKATKSHKNLA